MNTTWMFDAGPSPEVTNPRREWTLACLSAALAGIILLAAFLGGKPYFLLAAIVAMPVGIWLVFSRPIWAVLLYIAICGSPFFGIYDYIEPGEYAAGALLVLLLLRESLRGGLAEYLGPLSKPYCALLLVFFVSAITALFYGNGASSWAREQAQYLPILLGPIVARNLRSRRQVLAIVLVSAATAVIALPF